jgi:hypothetical protein
MGVLKVVALILQPTTLHAQVYIIPFFNASELNVSVSYRVICAANQRVI